MTLLWSEFLCHLGTTRSRCPIILQNIVNERKDFFFLHNIKAQYEAAQRRTPGPLTPKVERIAVGSVYLSLYHLSREVLLVRGLDSLPSRALQSVQHMPAVKRKSTRGRNDKNKANRLGLNRRENQSLCYHWKEMRKHIFSGLVASSSFFPFLSSEFPWADSAFVYRTPR